MTQAARAQSDMTDLHQLSTFEPQEIDQLKKAWESAVKGLTIACEQVKHRGIIPFLRWALLMMGDVSKDQVAIVGLDVIMLERRLVEERESHKNTRLRGQQLRVSLNEAEEKLINSELQCKKLEERLAAEKESHANTRLQGNEKLKNSELQCTMLEQYLVTEEDAHKKTRLRCLELERGLQEEKERPEEKKLAEEHEMMRRRCVLLETNLRAEEENARKLKSKCADLEASQLAGDENIQKMKLRYTELERNLAILKRLLKKAEKKLEEDQEEDQKLLIEMEGLKAQGVL